AGPAGRAPGAVLAFPAEVHAGPEALLRRASRRYAHSRRYVAELLDAGGFDVVSMEQAHLRSDRGAPISGLVVLAARRGPTASAMVIAGETGDEAVTPAVH